ncbi:MAG: DUF502 domain-containing protein [Thermodesulfovibrionales bacterium]|nr:DUF502 domain-containing protein [Thermodesulfovibrionales bacterium]
MIKKISNILKRKFLAGLFVTIPVVASISVLMILFNFIDGILGPFFDYLLGFHTVGLGFISALLVVLLIGILSTNVFGRSILGFIEKIFFKIPVLKSVYFAIKQLVNAFSPENKGSFKKFVIAEYPRQGVYAFGFLTKECTISNKDGKISMKTVYIPTNNLYLGEIVMLDEKSIIYTDLSIDEGIKIILSGGTAAPKEILAFKEEDR